MNEILKWNTWYVRNEMLPNNLSSYTWVTTSATEINSTYTKMTTTIFNAFCQWSRIKLFSTLQHRRLMEM